LAFVPSSLILTNNFLPSLGASAGLIAEQRANLELLGDGNHWPEIGENLSAQAYYLVCIKSAAIQINQ